MKLLTTIICSLFLTKNCKKNEETTTNQSSKITTENVVITNETEQNQLKGVKLWYEANTRGYHFQFTLENGKASAVYVRDTKPEEVKIKPEDLAKIASLYSKIDLEKFVKLQGPTTERYHDGKAHANLHIFKDNKEYQTEGFDHSIPPAEIKEICDLICKIGEKKE